MPIAPCWHIPTLWPMLWPSNCHPELSFAAVKSLPGIALQPYCRTPVIRWRSSPGQSAGPLPPMRLLQVKGCLRHQAQETEK